MVAIDSLEQFLATETPYISTESIVISMLLAALFSYVIYFLYVKYGRALSNRRLFGHNFLLIILTTTLVITIVKSSLALSLGLVGALSIVRFRAAIKEPEELAYLFLCISIGLGLGANQYVITAVALFLICVFIFMRGVLQRRDTYHQQNLFVSISGKKDTRLNIRTITKILQRHCDEVNLKRVDEQDGRINTNYFVAFQSFSSLEKTTEQLHQLSKNVSITYLDN